MAEDAPDLSGAAHTEDLYEVEGSYHYHRTEQGERVRLEPGDRFHPTTKQVADGSLEGKARKVSESSGSTSATVGADIGLRALDWGSEKALEVALEAGIDADAFAEAVEPGGATGYVTSDVRGYLEGSGGEDTS